MTSGDKTYQKRKAIARKLLIQTLSSRQTVDLPLTRRHTVYRSDRITLPHINNSLTDTSPKQQKVNKPQQTDTSARRKNHSGNGKPNIRTNKQCKLPAVINDVNAFICSDEPDSDVTETSLGTLPHHDIYLTLLQSRNKLKQMKQQAKVNFCWMRHRPLTPNLINKLNKAKLPPKVQTERWIQQLPVINRWRFGSTHVTSQKQNVQTVDAANTFIYGSSVYDDTIPLTDSPIKDVQFKYRS